MKTTIYIVSGGSGASGEQVVHTILAQFPENSVHVVTIPNIRHSEQIVEVIRRVKQHRGILVHTMVDPELRQQLLEQAESDNVTAFDLMGPLMEYLANIMGQKPVGEPGLYRRLNQTYYDRIAAIDFAMSHDDGRNPDGWDQADVVLVGVSRSGKTPLSLYLSVLGWKAANIPIVPGIDLADRIFKLDRTKVVGLTIDAGQLLLLRQQRQRLLGTTGLSDYTNPQKVHEELSNAREILRRSGFKMIDVTDKPIETSADEVIRLVSTGRNVKERQE